MLAGIDADRDAVNKILAMENEFRRRVALHIGGLPLEDAVFQKFSTNPFVLLIHAMHKGYSRVSQIEADILPAKLFTSMETSAGKMVEAVMLEQYGWTNVISNMHTVNSAIDGKKLAGDTVKIATLKSGPKCLNDEMSENFADAIIAHSTSWAAEAGVKKVDFTFGVLYGTHSMSMKKDWHILRNLEDKLPQGSITVSPHGRYDCAFTRDGIEATASVRIGKAWWDYMGGPQCFVSLCAAMIRACVQPGVTGGESDAVGHAYTIQDLGQITSLASVPQDYNVSILQRGQLQWMFFIARHFCDQLVD